MGRLTTASSRSGCHHCLSCKGLYKCREKPHTMELWPASLRSPTVYYKLKTRQLEYNCKMAAEQKPGVYWREAVTQPSHSPLLQRRGLPQLTLQVPNTRGNIKPDECLVYVRAVQLPASRPAAAPGAAAMNVRASEATQAPAPARHSCGQATPPQRAEQPAKRTRLLLSGEGSMPQAAQRGHLIARSPGLAASARVVATLSSCATNGSRSRHSTASTPRAAGSPLGALFRKMRGMMSSPTQQFKPQQPSVVAVC